MTDLPVLETRRLFVRPFALFDLIDIHRILDGELSEARPDEASLARRQEWLQWTVLGYDQFARLYQPPYGERAVVLKSSGELIGAVGYVPLLDFFDQLPFFAAHEARSAGGYATVEFGQYWAISPRYQRQGLASEAAGALIDYAFHQLHLKRVVATTEAGNTASQGVMRRLGMRLERNPYPDPPWLQVVGVLENRAA